MGCEFRWREATGLRLFEQTSTYSKKRDARPAGRGHLHAQRRLKHVFEQIALKNGGGRSDAQTFSFLQQHHLIGVFSREIQFVRDHQNGVAIFRRQSAQRFQKIDLRADVEVKRGLVQQKQKRLLRQGARQNDALFFAAGDFVHPAIGEMQRTHLRESVLGDGDVVFGFEAKAAAVGVTALQNKFPHARRKEQATFLLNQGDALGANLWRESECVANPFRKMRPERGSSAPEISLSSVDLPLAFGPRIATISPGLA